MCLRCSGNGDVGCGWVGVFGCYVQVACQNVKALELIMRLKE